MVKGTLWGVAEAVGKPLLVLLAGAVVLGALWGAGWLFLRIPADTATALGQLMALPAAALAVLTGAAAYSRREAWPAEPVLADWRARARAATGCGIAAGLAMAAAPWVLGFLGSVFLMMGYGSDTVVPVSGLAMLAWSLVLLPVLAGAAWVLLSDPEPRTKPEPALP